jgi:hypothetical protein
MSDTSERIIVGCAAEIADRPGLWSRLLAEHTAGSDGRCRGCPSAVQLAPRSPCRIAVLAATAHAMHGGPAVRPWR